MVFGGILWYLIVFCGIGGIWWYWGKSHPSIWYGMVCMVCMVWYGKQKGQKLGFQQSMAGCPVPLKTLKRLKGWEDERIERIARIERIERIEWFWRYGEIFGIVKKTKGHATRPARNDRRRIGGFLYPAKFLKDLSMPRINHKDLCLSLAEASF